MKQFIIDMIRGILVGLIVWYILRPDEPAFNQLADAVAGGTDVGRSAVTQLVDDPVALLTHPTMEHGLVAAGAGAALGVLFWMVQQRRGRVRSRVVASRKGKK